jgi:WD40 repeat protein
MPIELEKIDRVSFPMGIMDLAVTSDGSTAYAACMDGVYAYRFPSDSKDSATEKSKPIRIGQHTSYVSGIGLIESSLSLISTSYDGSIQFRDLAESSEPALPPKFSNRIHSFWSWRMALSPDQRYVASVTGQYLAGSEDYSPLPAKEPTVIVLDASTGRRVQAFEMLPSVQCVAFDPSSRYVAAGNLIGDLAVWDIVYGEQVAKWNTPSFTSWGIIKSHCFIGGIYAVAFSPDGDSLYAAGMGEMRDPMAANGKQRWQRFAWRKAPVEKLQETLSDESGEGLMETLAWSPSNDYFVMAGRLRGGNWNIGIFGAETGKLIGQAKTGMRITSARFSPDGSVLHLAGMQGQPAPKKGEFPSFGYLERYRVKGSVG